MVRRLFYTLKTIVGVSTHRCSRRVLLLDKSLSWMQLYSNPKHPYTQALLSAIPVPDPTKKSMTIPLKGDVPSALSPPSGCSFRTRCPKATEHCAQEIPVASFDGEHMVRCHLYIDNKNKV
ncbi:hypothetical protein ABVD55_000291 [Vibrio harveyi]